MRLGESTGVRTDGKYVTFGLLIVFSQCSNELSALLRSFANVSNDDKHGRIARICGYLDFWGYRQELKTIPYLKMNPLEL
ncbi:hypothetical protein AYI69_g335 [Smittium culicis]|uniref:Uncharacterized protein n=1 Tax=Smittium culicis TaxID=133412 RepID=A0A1R1YTC2_9FUNG|nr:hypothetical protein AYI69_g335 [Smittium culicis]